jgi:hypothetical protein
MAAWLESQGYDVSYTSNFDVHTNPGLLLQHKRSYRWGMTSTGRRKCAMGSNRHVMRE